jgi:hypothetical protein
MAGLLTLLYTTEAARQRFMTRTGYQSLSSSSAGPLPEMAPDYYDPSRLEVS